MCSESVQGNRVRRLLPIPSRSSALVPVNGLGPLCQGHQVDIWHVSMVITNNKVNRLNICVAVAVELK